MLRSLMRKTLLMAFAALALPATGIAGVVLVPLNTPSLNQGVISIDLEAQTYTIGGFPAGTDFAFNLFNTPYALTGTTSSDGAYSSTIVLLDEGATVDSSLSFQQYAYFPASTPTGTHYIGFQTAADLDGNSGTTGIHYGFFQVEVGSLSVTGYGFESTPGVAVTTMPVPEPTVGGLVLLAMGGVFAVRRYLNRHTSHSSGPSC